MGIVGQSYATIDISTDNNQRCFFWVVDPPCSSFINNMTWSMIGIELGSPQSERAAFPLRNLQQLIDQLPLGLW